MTSDLPNATTVVIGAGAAGLFAAIHAGDVLLLNNEERLGLKILVSGGGRCNLTNARVDERDFTTDAPHLLRGLLRGFSVDAAKEFFESAGVALYEEPLGKVFPQSDRARDVLAALLRASEDAGVNLIAPAEAVSLEREGTGWRVGLADGREIHPRQVILATGGKSLPKTGSRGAGFEMLAALGHTIVPPRPALTPLELDGPLRDLQGITVPAVLTLVTAKTRSEQVSGSKLRPLAHAGGSLLVTHDGASGPAALDVSGACARALHEGTDVKLLGDFWSLAGLEGPWASYLERPKPPGACLPPADTPRPPTWDIFRKQLRSLSVEGEVSLVRGLSHRIPRALVQALLDPAHVDPKQRFRKVPEGIWKRVHLALTQADLALSGIAGYHKAEVTTGGVLLSEVDRRTLESKLHPGLFVCGEVVNVTGRLGGFNFQWAWASGYAAGRGARATASA